MPAVRASGPSSDELIQHGLSLLEARDREGLVVYHPATPAQEMIHRLPALRLIVRGGNRSGKTTCCVAEVASRILGVPVKTLGGQEIPLKYPTSTAKSKHKYWLIGWDLDHIGRKIYPALFQPGLFRVIQDSETKKWRTWNPANPDDAKRADQTKPSEPMIPARFIDHSTWVWNAQGGGKKAKCFKSVTLLNGAEIRAYPSSGIQAAQGDAVDGIYIDEDVQHADHVQEWLRRLTDRKDYGTGWFIWGAWPHIDNYALINAIELAEASQVEPIEDRVWDSVQLVMSENPFFTDDAKAVANAGCDEETIARRDRGETLLESLTMYDYVPAIHAIRSRDSAEPTGLDTLAGMLTDIWNERRCFPDAWTRYLAIDPSHTRTAVSFGVVTPPSIHGQNAYSVLILEDELVLRRAGAKQLAQAVKDKMKGRHYEAFIMDKRIGQQTRVGMTSTVFDVYAEEFKAEGVRSRQTSYSFIPGCDVPPVRYDAVRKLLEPTYSAPRLYIVADTCFYTVSEFKRYRKKVTDHGGNRIVCDEPNNPRVFDCMAALEYLVAYVKPLLDANMAYVDPAMYPQRKDVTLASLAASLTAGRGQFIHFGPGSVV